jgi:hypothetical protein
MATQRESLGFTTTEFNHNDGLIAGEKYQTEMNVTIAQGQPALSRGQILIGPATAATRYVDDATSDADLIIGVLGKDMPAATSGTLKAFMYVEGEFNEDKLVGLDTPARVAMQKLNIYAKRVD